MQPSEHIFQSISSVSLISGITCIHTKRVSSTLSMCGDMYLTASIIIFALNAILVSYVFWDFTEGGGSGCTVSVMNVYGIFLASYYIVRQEKLFENFQNFLQIKDLFCLTSDDLLLYEEVFGKQMKRINRFIICFFFFNLSLMPINVLQKVLAYESEYLRQFLSKGNPVFYPVYYFNVKSSAVIFWPTFIFEAVALQVLITLHTVNDLYILNVTMSMILSFRYLRLKLKNILQFRHESMNTEGNTLEFKLKLFNNPHMRFSNENPPNHLDLETVEGRVKMWVKYHNHVLRLSREFISLYTPVLVVFFLFIFINGSMGIFYITKGEADIYSPSEKLIIILYFMGSVKLFMVICMAGTYLQEESEKVCQDAFHAPWFVHDRSVKSALLTISSVCRRPVRLTPLLSQTAEMSLSTFVWVLNSMASFYIAFSRIQAIYTQNRLREETNLAF